jgi:hypothetical protein
VTDAPPPGPRPRLLANDFVTVLRSPEPQHLICTTPGIVALDSGRLVATCGFRALPPRTLEPPMTPRGEGVFQWQTFVFTSDDAGRTWTRRGVLPMLHARPFAAGRAVYVLGHAGDLRIARSDDDGGTWSAAADLTRDQWWHQAACSVEYANGKVYLVMERRTHRDLTRWDVSALAPVLMAAPVDADLLERSSWRFSNELTFQRAVTDAGLLGALGVPFYPTDAEAARRLGTRPMAAPGWLETNVVRFRDPRHLWHDPAGRTFYLFMRAHTGTTNLAALARGVEDERGQLTVELAAAPSGAPLVYLPFPGGHLKFFILYDAPSARFWLAASQATDSLARPESVPPGRHSLPNGERHRLALHHSTNGLDWQLAGLVAVGDAPGESRHYASLAVSGDDLLVLSRSGDSLARNAHDCNLITLHRVRRFRELV